MRLAGLLVAFLFVACASPAPRVDDQTGDTSSDDPLSDPDRETETTMTVPTVQGPQTTPTEPPRDEPDMLYDFEDEPAEGALQLDE